MENCNIVNECFSWLSWYECCVFVCYNSIISICIFMFYIMVLISIVNSLTWTCLPWLKKNLFTVTVTHAIKNCLPATRKQSWDGTVSHWTAIHIMASTCIQDRNQRCNMNSWTSLLMEIHVLYMYLTLPWNLVTWTAVHNCEWR